MTPVFCVICYKFTQHNLMLMLCIFHIDSSKVSILNIFYLVLNTLSLHNQQLDSLIKKIISFLYIRGWFT